eukprot:gene5240-6521_t
MVYHDHHNITMEEYKNGGGGGGGKHNHQNGKNNNNIIEDKDYYDDDDEKEEKEDNEEEEDEEQSTSTIKRKKLKVVEEEESVEEKKLRLAKEFVKKFTNAKGDLDEDAMKQDLENQSGRKQKSLKEKISKLVITQDENITVLKGHNQPVTAIVLSDDEKIAYSASKDVIIKWDLISKQKLDKIIGFIPSKKNLQLKQQQKENKKNNKESSNNSNGNSRDLNSNSYKGKIFAMALSYDGKYLVTGGEEKVIKVWDTETMKIVETFRGHQDMISALTFRKGTYTLYSGSHDRTLKIWDLSQMAYVDTSYGHQSPITAIDALTRERCITSGTDKTCRIWKIPEGKQYVFRGHSHSIDTVTLLGEDKFMSGSQDGAISLWNVNKKNAVYTKNRAHPKSDLPWITSVAAVKYSDLVASGSCDGKIKLWGVTGEKFAEINRVPIQGFPVSLKNINLVDGIEFHPLKIV